jgi:hypothetical protein
LYIPRTTFTLSGLIIAYIFGNQAVAFFGPDGSRQQSEDSKTEQNGGYNLLQSVLSAANQPP